MLTKYSDELFIFPHSNKNERLYFHRDRVKKTRHLRAHFLMENDFFKPNHPKYGKFHTIFFDAFPNARCGGVDCTQSNFPHLLGKFSNCL